MCSIEEDTAVEEISSDDSCDSSTDSSFTVNDEEEAGKLGKL